MGRQSVTLAKRRSTNGGAKQRSPVSFPRKFRPLFRRGQLPKTFPATAGKVGLQNLGNTCFMNAGLQCLSHIELFTEYFLSERFRKDINRKNIFGSKGKLAEAFASLLVGLWRRGRASHNPRSLRAQLSRCAPHLCEGYQQHDAQEFIAFCIDGLHEDLSRVSTRPQPLLEEQETEEERLANKHGEEAAAALSWMRRLERDRSFLADLFQGQLRSSVTCTRCNLQQRRFEPFFSLSVPVAKGGGTSHVSESLKAYLEEETLRGGERWMCPRCSKKVDALKKIDLWKLPAVLVLHLKRFEFDQKQQKLRKIDTFLDTPLSLDLSDYVSSELRSTAMYDIVAVANHKGTLRSGHYTACCRVRQNRGGCAWRHFDDEIVAPVAASEVIGREAYVLFLVRRAANARPVRQQIASSPRTWPHKISKATASWLESLCRSPARQSRKRPASAIDKGGGAATTLQRPRKLSAQTVRQ